MTGILVQFEVSDYFGLTAIERGEFGAWLETFDRPAIRECTVRVIVRDDDTVTIETYDRDNTGTILADSNGDPSRTAYTWDLDRVAPLPKALRP